jgi:hypothetical protein
MRTETVSVTLTVEARDDITRDEILHDLRPLLEGLQESEPWRHDTGEAWYVNRRSHVQISDTGPAQKTVTFDPDDAVSITRALRGAVKPETLRIVASAELTR